MTIPERRGLRFASGAMYTSYDRCDVLVLPPFLWYKNANTIKAYSYECYRQKRQVSKKFLKAHGLDTAQVCHTKSIPFWHIDFMALRVFQTVWKDQKEAILMSCKILEKYSIQKRQQSSTLLESFQNQLDRLHTKLEGLRGMCAMGDITREEFLHDKQSIQSDIERLQVRIEDLSVLSLSPAPTLDMAQIKCTLDSWLDFPDPAISDVLIAQFILQVVFTDDDTFNRALNLSSDKGEKRTAAS